MLYTLCARLCVDNIYVRLGLTHIFRYKLSGGGIEVVIYSLGGIIQSILVPDNSGNIADVSLGHDTPQGRLLSIQPS